jgi:hypothetical protein
MREPSENLGLVLILALPIGQLIGFNVVNTSWAIRWSVSANRLVIAGTLAYGVAYRFFM